MPAKDEVWIFGYGSLMWRPGFDFVERAVTRLHGYHRRLCVWSFRHRGSPDNPGLVFGLDRGGSCRGVAYRIAPDRAEAVLAYLHDREMIYGIYRPAQLPVTLIAGPQAGRPVRARAYVVDRRHPQYAGGLTTEQRAASIVASAGVAGRCRDYLANTVNHLCEMGMPDRDLAALHRLVEEIRAGDRPAPAPPPHPAGLDAG